MCLVFSVEAVLLPNGLGTDTVVVSWRSRVFVLASADMTGVNFTVATVYSWQLAVAVVT